MARRAHNYQNLPWLFFGVSALYLGGMFLNDAFDVDYDRQQRPERPIPSGAMTVPVVWAWGMALLVLGAVSLIILGKTTGERRSKFCRASFFTTRYTKSLPLRRG